MTTVYCLKKVLCFSDSGNCSASIFNHFKMFLWILLMHIVALSMGYEFFAGLLYGPILMSLVFRIANTRINRVLLLLQFLPFIGCMVLGYLTTNSQVIDLISLLTSFSLVIYGIFLGLYKQKLRGIEFRKSVLYCMLFLVFLLAIILMSLIEEYSYVFKLVSPKVSLAIFLLCSISITVIHLLRNQIPGFVQTNVEEVVDQIDDARPVLVESIESYFITSQHYLNPCFTFDKFAKEMDVPKNILSTVLNREMNKNFYQLLAEHRIEHAKTLLIKQDYLFTIESVVYDCGFNSKSSFHKYFKQFVGTTPSDFRDHYLKK